MALPLEFLLRVEQPRDIDRGFVVAEQLRSRDAQRVDRRKCWRHTVGRVGADGARKIRDAFGFDLESNRRVGAPGDRCHAEKAKA